MFHEIRLWSARLYNQLYLAEHVLNWTGAKPSIF